MESHQREKGLSMDWYGHQNDKVDELAKQYVTDFINRRRKHEPVRLWYEHFSLWVDGIKQSQICKKRLYKRLQRENIYSYWETHHDFPIQSPHAIDWEPSRLAMNRLHVGLKRWLAKFTTGSIGNRHKLHQRGEVGTA